MTTSKNLEVKQLIYSLLTTNTGTHPLDNGGVYGRHWERNSKKTIEDFEAEPQAVLDVGHNDLYPTISLYHFLTRIFELDDLCNEFNALPVDDWDCEDYYGVSKAGEQWLADHDFEPIGDTFNSYNGDSILSQIIQGETFKVNETYYCLLQVHGGCDVSKGYTDAKLFRLEDEYHLYNEDCSFKYGEGENERIEFRGGEWIDHEGEDLDNDKIEDIAKRLKAAGKQYVVGYLG
jgi:hypothetical protein